MPESTVVVPLYPTFVWKVQLQKREYETVNQKIRAKLDELTAGMRPLLRGEKLQTDKNLHTLEEFRDLTGFIHGAATGVLEFLKVDYDTFEINACWANISAPQDRHRLHTHPNSFLSGVYYVQTQPGANTLTFEDPRPQRHTIMPRFKETVRENAWVTHLTVNEGELVLFPAWLPHCVERNSSGHERISVSFNIMFPNFGGAVRTTEWNVSTGYVPTTTR